jgi:HK97 family phage portal protein
MTNLLDRMSHAVSRFIDGPPESRAAAMEGFGLNTPNYQLNTPRWLDPNIGNYRKAFASQVAVYACVLARARAVSSAPVRVYQERAGDRTELPDHPLRLLMANPNPTMSEAEFLVMTQTLMDATGFAAIEKVRAGAGNVVQLWHVRSDWLKEIRRSNQPSNWEFRVPGRDAVIIPAEDIIIIPGGPSTDLGTIGMSPIAVALREIGIDAGLTDFLKLFIESGGTPRYALVTPNQVKNQQDADDLRNKFGTIYGGFQNWTKTVCCMADSTTRRSAATSRNLLIRSCGR